MILSRSDKLVDALVRTQEFETEKQKPGMSSKIILKRLSSMRWITKQKIQEGRYKEVDGALQDDKL